MRVLFVSATLPPEGMATAGIIGNIMQEMRKRGIIVSGLTFKNHMNEKTVSKWNDIKIYRADYIREYGFKCQTVKDCSFKISRKIYDLRHKEDLYPYRELAVNALVKCLKEIEADANYDFIVSAAAFYDSVEAATRYKKSINPKAKYVFYQLDPLQENLAFKDISPNWKQEYEKSLYAQFDLVFTTREIYATKSNKHWQINNVFAVDYPCVDVRLSNRRSSLRKPEKEIRCVYAGQLNDSIRDASTVLKILSSVKSSSIQYYFIGEGQDELLHKYSEDKLKNHLHILGKMTAENCEEWILSADVLLIIGNNVDIQVPSKVFSYMSYGIPVIATYKIKECSANTYLNKIPNSLLIDETEKDINLLATKIEKFIVEYAGTRLKSQDIEQYADIYTAKYVVDEFIRAFGSIKEN